MCFTKQKFVSKKYAVTIVMAGLALLTGCSGDDKKAVSHSSASSSSVSNSSLINTSVSSSSAFQSSLSNSSQSNSSLSDSPYIGQWYAPAYGYVLSVSVERDFFTVKKYSVTKNYCLLQDVVADLSFDAINQDYIYSPIGLGRLLESKGEYPPAVEYTKADQLPAICEGNIQNRKMDAGYTFDAKKDFDIFWQTFNELYINFELRGVNWDNVYEEAIKSVDDIKTEDELFEFLGALITPLGDGHAAMIKAPLGQNVDVSIAAALDNDETRVFGVSTQLTVYQKLINEFAQTLEADGALNGEMTDAQMAAANEYYASNYLQLFDIIFGYANKTSGIEMRAAGEIAWFKTSDNIGYLIIGAMSGYDGKSPLIADVDSDIAIAEAAIDDALTDLIDTDGIIIDVRINEGGHDQVALNFVRHFINKPQVVYAKFAGSGAGATPLQEVVLDPQNDNIYIKPTALLVSGDTASAAELFTLAMASLPQVIVIGERTAGEFSDILVKRLASDILFGISNETYLDVQGKNYEHTGIPVDIAVPFATPQERKGGYDVGVDKAIDWIKSVR